MSSQEMDIFSPENIFGEEQSQESQSMTRIHSEAKQALRQQSEVSVKTKFSEQFRGFIDNITEKSDGIVINFKECNILGNPFKAARTYYIHDIAEFAMYTPEEDEED